MSLDIDKQARARNAQRWSRHTRDWTAIGAVTLNPERASIVQQTALTQALAA